jgi:AcrR family transcriptional regulator
MGSGLPCATCPATHSSSSRTTRWMSRPVSSDAIPAISSNVTAAPAVTVTGPSKDRWPARITAAASPSSARSVQDTGPSAGRPTIYRLFGDKSGLLDAVIEHGFASYLARKPPADADDDPVEGLHAGWELHVGFGLANPELFRLMHAALRTPDGRAAAAAGAGVLRARVRRVAEAGRLRVTERRAVELISAVGTGVVFTLIDQPGNERDDTLADIAWQSVCAAILTDASSAAITGPAAAAVTLRAALPGLEALAAAERALLGDWLDRIAESTPRTDASRSLRSLPAAGRSRYRIRGRRPRRPGSRL